MVSMNKKQGTSLSEHSILHWHRKNLSKGHSSGNIGLLLPNCIFSDVLKWTNHKIRWTFKKNEYLKEMKKRSGASWGTCLFFPYLQIVNSRGTRKKKKNYIETKMVVHIYINDKTKKVVNFMTSRRLRVKYNTKLPL